VNRETFTHLFNQTDQVSSNDKEALEEIVVQYPYFQLAHFLLAKAYNQEAAGKATDKVKKAAVYAPDRGMLRKFLATKKLTQEYTTSPPASTTATKVKQADSLTAKSNPAAEPKIDPPVLPIIDYQLVTPQEETQISLPSSGAPLAEEAGIETDNRKIKKLKQNEIIENFIKAEPRISAAQAKAKVEETGEDLSEKGLDSPAGFISENLANIMVKQGKFDKAIDIYEKLILKYPQKNAYFAAKIEELKKL
jgi:tetratricopeptide (TPR) repeat protein